MRPDPKLTFHGALAILGSHERPRLAKLNTILGGVILASGMAVDGATLSGLTLPADGWWSAVSGWITQAPAAIGLLGQMLGSVTDKRNHISRYEWNELIGAAHTVIVAAAFFEVLRERLGRDSHAALKISDATAAGLMRRHLGSTGQTLIERLYDADVPPPSASRGFVENVPEVARWLANFESELREFLAGLPASPDGSLDFEPVTDAAVARYRSHYLELAAKVPEFGLWASLGEAAAIRSIILQQNAELMTALDHSTAALARLEAVLALSSGRAGAAGSSRTRLRNANRLILDRPIISAGYDLGPGVTLPRVRQLYVNPRYRITRYRSDVPVADRNWWLRRPSAPELDLMLAVHVTLPDATRAPMLVLGDPGAGKSLLTQVLAARLPAAGYTAVRVPLREVGADAPIGQQVRTALDLATNKRVRWDRLSDESVGIIRVILLDGLDEMLQASSRDRSGYLQEVEEFQDREAALQRPVAVIVTSRIMAPGRVCIPDGTTIVKLDNFNEADIADWLGRWQAANTAAITAGRMRALTRQQALRQPELAQQPLLLLMLALYAASPARPELTAQLSTADFYQRLLDELAHREAKKDPDLAYAHGPAVDDRARDYLDRLAIAALAMFNRGQQDIDASLVAQDLAALDQGLLGRSRTDAAGQLVVGEFLFVHASDARWPVVTTGPDWDETGNDGPGEPPRRIYEFLHPTFGEYLIASYVMTTVRNSRARSRESGHSQDDLVFALLSQRPLAVRASILDFVRQRGTRLTAADRGKACDVLEMLLATYRSRRERGPDPGYRPTAADTVRQLACYSANLVVLRAELEPERGKVPLAELLGAPDAGDGLSQWQSTVRLWQSGLDRDELQAMGDLLSFSAGPAAIRAHGQGNSPLVSMSRADDAVRVARLAGDRAGERRARYGAALCDQYFYFDPADPGSWKDSLSSSLVSSIAGATGNIIVPPAGGISQRDAKMLAALIFNFLRTAPAVVMQSKSYLSINQAGEDDPVELEDHGIEALLQLLFALPAVFQFDQYALARAVLMKPSLIDAVPELRNADRYGPMYELIRSVGRPRLRAQMGEEAAAAPDAEGLLREIVHSWTATQRWES